MLMNPLDASVTRPHRAVPKGYLYFAIFFSLFTEMLNIRMKKAQKPIQLHGYGEEAKKRGLLDENLLDNEEQQK